MRFRGFLEVKLAIPQGMHCKPTPSSQPWTSPKSSTMFLRLKIMAATRTLRSFANRVDRGSVGVSWWKAVDAASEVNSGGPTCISTHGISIPDSENQTSCDLMLSTTYEAERCHSSGVLARYDFDYHSTDEISSMRFTAVDDWLNVIRYPNTVLRG